MRLFGTHAWGWAKQPHILPCDRHSFLKRSKEHDPTDGSSRTDGAMLLLPMEAAPASPQASTEPSLEPFLPSLQCANLIQPGDSWREPPSSSKCGTCTFILMTWCLAIRSWQRRATVMGHSAGGSHSQPQLMTHVLGREQWL